MSKFWFGKNMDKCPLGKAQKNYIVGIFWQFRYVRISVKKGYGPESLRQQSNLWSAGRSNSWLDSGPGIFHIENLTFTTRFENIYSVIYLKKNYEKQYSLHTFKTIEQNTSHSTKRKQKI